MTEPEDHALRAELVDEITEAVVTPTDPRVRAKVISELVHEVDEAVKWRHQRHPHGQEERSLGGLVDAAEAHQERMQTLGESLHEDNLDGDTVLQEETELPRRGISKGGATAI
ncbi:MAG TPA: hypothetical protein VEQ66_01540 [Propionibacteriaceae bacterium]|nr:hypothetical protein [Propionibacteriaceae bacterium]